MFPTQSPIYFPPTTRRPIRPTNTPFAPSNVPSFLDILTTTNQPVTIFSYSSQNNDAFIPLNIQYAVVSISGCFLITIITLCILLCCKTKMEIRSEEDNEAPIVEPSITRGVSIKFPNQEHKILFLQLEDPPFTSRRNVVEDNSQIIPMRPPYPPPQPPLTRSRSLPPNQNYYRG